MKMTDEEFSQYLVSIMLKGGIDCCSICYKCPKYAPCINGDVCDDTVCLEGMREYAEVCVNEK